MNIDSVLTNVVTWVVIGVLTLVLGFLAGTWKKAWATPTGRANVALSIGFAVLISVVLGPVYHILFPNSIATNGTIPVGAVVAFNLEECPESEGWREFVPAYGRFVRGIDKSSAEIDPEGQREMSSVQEDQFRSHSHSISKQRPLVHRDHGGGTGEDLDPGGWAGHTALTIDPSGGAETRPKNVALLYCEKESG